MIRCLLLGLGVAALLTFSPVASALAAEPLIRLGITPVDHDGTYFDLTLRPGQRRVLSVELANFGTEPVEARTYAADVYTIVNGGLGAELHDEPRSGPTRWVDYPTKTLELPGGHGTVIDLVVEVPSYAEPGEYVTSLAIENAEPITGSGSVAINQVTRTVIAVAITVPGPRRPRLEIGGARHELANGVSVVSFTLSNSGNVHLRPEGEFFLETDDGRVVSRAPIKMDTFFARTDAVVEVPLAEALHPGTYCASLSLRDAEQEVSAVTECLPFLVEDSVADAPLPQGSSPAGAAVAQPDAPSTIGGLPWWVAVAGATVLLTTAVVGGAALALRPRGRGIP
jgi:hypothetical protein